MTSFPILDADVRENELGHLGAHDALHAFYNAFAPTLEGRLQALEQALAAVGTPPVGHAFSRPGTAIMLLSLLDIPMTGPGFIPYVDVHITTAPGAPGTTVDVTKNGVSIFDASGPFIRPNLVGVTYAVGIPNPARASVLRSDGIRAHITQVGTPAGANVSGNVALIQS